MGPNLANYFIHANSSPGAEAARARAAVCRRRAPGLTCVSAHLGDDGDSRSPPPEAHKQSPGFCRRQCRLRWPNLAAGGRAIIMPPSVRPSARRVSAAHQGRVSAPQIASCQPFVFGAPNNRQPVGNTRARELLPDPPPRPRAGRAPRPRARESRTRSKR